MYERHIQEFKDVLFMGNGCSNDCTEGKILKLQNLLSDCLTAIGGLQQSPQGAKHPDGEDGWKREYVQGWAKVRDMVKDIAMALTGEKIKFPCDIEEDKRNEEIDEQFSRGLDGNDDPLYEDDEVNDDLRCTAPGSLSCGDIKTSDGTTYWCGKCNECKRFDAGYEAFLEYYAGYLTRQEYYRQASIIKDKFGD